MSGPVWAIVPMEATADMLVQNTYASMLAAGPGNALLSEILAARDAIDKAKTLDTWDREVANLRKALAKLGPAA